MFKKNQVLIRDYYNETFKKNKAEEINIASFPDVKPNIKKPVKYNQSIKCVILGDSGIGKTSIIKKYNSSSVSAHNESTLGAIYWELFYKYDEERNIRINFWDTAGQERYNSLIPMYVRECDIIILTFDLTYYDSFKNLSKWYKFVLDNYDSPKIIIVGNKVDLKSHCIVSDKDINEFINDNFDIKPKFFKTSAVENTNIKNLFNHIFDLTKQIIDKRLDKRLEETKDYIKVEQIDNKNKCCIIL
jgi:small GTP-binding protein